MLPECLCVRLCVHPETLLPQYIEYLLTEFGQTFHQVTDFGARMNASNFGVKGQGHSGVKYALKCIFLVEA